MSFAAAPSRSSTLLGRTAAEGGVITVIQGSQHISVAADVVLGTVLGSCVAACLWDEAAGVGGMNHFLLPAARNRGEAQENVSRGAHAMELLINGLLTRGASRGRLQAKLFGGAAMRQGLTDVGEQNAAFAERFLSDEGIALVGSSLRGRRGRRVKFWPMSGRVMHIFLQTEEELAPVRAPPLSRPAPAADLGELELF